MVFPSLLHDTIFSRSVVHFLFMINVCPRSSAPFYVVNYYIKWATTSWTYCTMKIGQNFLEKRYETNNLQTSELNYIVILILTVYDQDMIECQLFE